jgi:hypothetical protein
MAFENHLAWTFALEVFGDYIAFRLLGVSYLGCALPAYGSYLTILHFLVQFLISKLVFSLLLVH